MHDIGFPIRICYNNIFWGKKKKKLKENVITKKILFVFINLNIDFVQLKIIYFCFIFITTNNYKHVKAGVKYRLR